MQEAINMTKLREDILRRERYVEEYLQDHPVLQKFYRTDEEVIKSAIAASALKSAKLMEQASIEQNKVK